MNAGAGFDLGEPCSRRRASGSCGQRTSKSRCNLLISQLYSNPLDSAALRIRIMAAKSHGLQVTLAFPGGTRTQTQTDPSGDPGVFPKKRGREPSVGDKLQTFPSPHRGKCVGLARFHHDLRFAWRNGIPIRRSKDG